MSRPMRIGEIIAEIRQPAPGGAPYPTCPVCHCTKLGCGLNERLATAAWAEIHGSRR